MTFGQLEILVALADARGFTLAAQRLGITQSAVSHAIKSLETEFGTELVVRRHVQVDFTEIGIRLLSRAREILGLSETMRQEAASFRGLKMGSVRVASFGPSSSLHLLPNILAEFRKAYPEIDVYVEEGPDEEVVRWIEERKVDLGFVVLPDDRFETYPLIEDQFVALIPRDHVLADQPAVKLKEICDHPFIMTEAGSEGGIAQLFSNAGLRPTTRSKTSQVLSTMALVSQGEGVAVVAELALPLTTGFAGFKVKPLAPLKKRSVGLALHSNEQATPATRAFIQTALSLKKRKSLLLPPSDNPLTINIEKG
ncbi:LysR family transcriptional regulator [Kiloniella sp.]|uniref:LysR family transcriptional regulator n=1 Tax=Kiloniella sp. TaxID=1938587 RepID=UPI003B02115C